MPKKSRGTESGTHFDDLPRIAGHCRKLGTPAGAYQTGNQSLNRKLQREITMRTRNTAIRLFIYEEYENKRFEFLSYGNGGQYSQEQKEYTFVLIAEYGIRATARILKVPRRTLQRWSRENHIRVKRCPDWVYGWAERRRKRKEFWARRGYV